MFVQIDTGFILAALVVSDCQGQERAHHAAAISDVAVEQEIRVGNFHLLIVRVNVVHQGIHRLGEVIRGAHVHVGSSGGLSSEVSSSGQVVVASLGLHDVGNQHVLSVPAMEQGGPMFFHVALLQKHLQT